MAKILIVEDEKQMADFITLELKHEGYEVDICYDGEQGYENAINKNYDIILLDIMLPKINGMEVCRRLRMKRDTPIIMLTAKEDITDKVNGLDIGADDYLTKPFEIEELLARMRVILRRKSQAINQSKIIQVADLKLDLEKKQVTRNDKNIELTKNMNELVSKLLYITKADTGDINLKKTKVNVQELINEIIEETKLIETDKNICSSSNEICYIEADISNVKELIRIFTDNAIKYTSRNGKIDIFSKKENGKIHINIKDNGIGISKEEQKSIFDRFYRVDKSRNKETGGMGLGLAIAKTIANVNGAEIKLESELGKGSIFVIIFNEYMEKK